MRKGVLLTVMVAALVLAACDGVSSILPSRLECDATEPVLCQQVANLSIAQMNLAATGRITEVVLESMDCEIAAKSYFLGDLREAEACWSVAVTGEASHGGGVVVLWPNGDLQPHW